MPRRISGRPLSRLVEIALTLVLTAGFVVALGQAASAAPSTPLPRATHAAGDPDLGPNTYVFDPSMPQSQIQSTVDAVAAEQLGNQFGPERYALLFKPGTYGSAASPLDFQVGYGTEVAGLGQNPNDVTINGAIDVFNQCDGGQCIALDNFWRSLSNLTINVVPGASAAYQGCYAGEFWAVSQAAPMRRVNVRGATTLMDYCTNPSFASGGFIADSRFDTKITSGSQQQFFVRNSALATDGWSNGVWNQVFSGVNNAPAQCYPLTTTCGPYTTVATTRASREKPYLYVDASGAWRVFVPSSATNSSGPTWSATTQTPGRSLPLSAFYLATPARSSYDMNRALRSGRNLLLTPGSYDIATPLHVSHTNAIVLGLGLPSLTPTHGNKVLETGDQFGIDIAGIVIDAGAINSPVLMQIGTHAFGSARSHSKIPTALQDVFFRIGGVHAGSATTSLVVKNSNVILDDIWAWRADHGTGVGWTQNTARTGLVVQGDDVTATGLFVEHYQGTEVAWSGQHGSITFFQNEMPYDVPSQSAWMSDANTDGYPALAVAPTVRSFTGYGLGSYSFFNQGIDIFADNAFTVPQTSGVQLHDLLTIFLDATNGNGGIRNVINGVGGSSTKANPDTPVTVTDYP